MIGGGPGGNAEHWVEGHACPVVRFSALTRPLHPLHDPLAVVQIAAHLARHRIQVLHTHTSKAGILGRLAARLAGTPVVLHTAHGWGFHSAQSTLRQRAYVALEQLAARCSTHIVGVSQATILRGLDQRIGRRSQYARSYCGIDSSRFSVKRNEEPLIGCVACLKPQKAPLEFIEVAAHLARNHPELRFELVGDGELRAQVKAHAHALGLEGRLELVGWQTDIPERLARYRLLLLTSRYEGLPLVLLEALAAGTPVVATAVDGTPEAIPESLSDYLYQPGDVAGAIQRVERLLDDPGEASRVARTGREHVLAHHRREQHLEEMTHLIESRNGVV